MQNNNVDLAAQRLVRWPEVQPLIGGISRCWVYQLMAKGKFPRSYKLSHRVAAWKLSDIQKWVEAHRPA